MAKFTIFEARENLFSMKAKSWHIPSIQAEEISNSTYSTFLKKSVHLTQFRKTHKKLTTILELIETFH